MLGRDATLILEALLSQPVISWRRWLTTQQRERELHFGQFILLSIGFIADYAPNLKTLFLIV